MSTREVGVNDSMTLPGTYEEFDDVRADSVGRPFIEVARNGIDLPLPGCGKTAERFDELRRQAKANSSVGRLYEAHADAIAILHEADRSPQPGKALAVWASAGSKPLRLFGSHGKDRFVLDGRKSFCGGASLVDAALVTAESADGQQLVLIELDQPGVGIDDTVWKTPAFRDAGICTVEFLNIPVDPSRLIGPPNWYGSRTGFWHGAVGVAAVWAGIADAIAIQMSELLRHHDQLADVAIGEVEAAQWAVGALLRAAASEIDARPLSAHAETALSCRYAIHAHIERILQTFDQEVGPAGVVFNEELGTLRQELALSLAQSHGNRDLAVLAKIAAGNLKI